MAQCYKSGDFNKYFRENMESLGMPVPSKLFDTFNAAVANAAVMTEALTTLGRGATVGELIGATTGLERLKLAASLGASFYVGAVVGSIAVASGRSMACGTRMADLFAFQKRYGLEFENSRHFFLTHPEVLSSAPPSAARYRAQAKAKAATKAA